MAVAESTIYITFQSGKVLTAYAPASAPVGSFLKLDKHGIAHANSPDEIVFNENDVITDVFFDAIGGAVEIINNDNPTGKLLFAATNQASNAGRKKHSLIISKGVSYRLKVVSQLTTA